MTGALEVVEWRQTALLTSTYAFDLSLQSHVLGFVLRQQLIHEVRREYEGIVESIQSPELLQSLPLPLANETIHWPHQNILCFPLFTSQEQELCEACHHSDQDTAVLQSFNEHSEGNQNADELQSPLSAQNFPTSTPNHSPQNLVTSKDIPISSPAESRPHQADNVRVDESSLNCLIEPLPRDREALLELRAQLALELLWIKQAIASRQEVSQCIANNYTQCHTLYILLQYLRLKQQYQSEHSATE